MLVRWFVKMGLGHGAAAVVSWAIPAALLIALLGGLWARGEHYRAEAAEGRADAESAQNALEAQQAAFRLAYAASIAEHTRLARAAERAGQVNKEKADEAYIEGMEAGRDAAARYLAANRVRPESNRTDPGSAGRPDLPGSRPAPGEPEGTGGPADLVAITAEDFGRCTAAAVRLNNAVNWANDYPGDLPLPKPD